MFSSDGNYYTTREGDREINVIIDEIIDADEKSDFSYTSDSSLLDDIDPRDILDDRMFRESLFNENAINDNIISDEPFHPGYVNQTVIYGPHEWNNALGTFIPNIFTFFDFMQDRIAYNYFAINPGTLEDHNCDELYQGMYRVNFNGVQLQPNTLGGIEMFNNHGIDVVEVLRNDEELLEKWKEYTGQKYVMQRIGPENRCSDISLPYWFPYHTTDEDIRVYVMNRSPLKDYFYEMFCESGAFLEGYDPETIAEYVYLVNDAYKERYFRNQRNGNDNEM